MTIDEHEDEKRGNLRYDYPATIEYVLHTEMPEKLLKAVTFNISTSGVGLYVFDKHAEGQKIVIKSDLPVACQTATICWVIEEQNGFYRAGARFINGSC